MTWFKREKKPIEPPDERRVVTEGLWIKCSGCKEPLWKKDLETNHQVCPKCSYHYKISAYDRINLIMDTGWTEHDSSLYSTDPLNFRAAKPYKESLQSLPKKVGVLEAVVNVYGQIDGMLVTLSAMEYNFIGGSMGSVVGEKITRSIERAIELNGASIDMNKQAFLWGRRAAHDIAAVEKLVAPPAPAQRSPAQQEPQSQPASQRVP